MEVVPRQVSKNKTSENFIAKVLLFLVVLHLTNIDLKSQLSIFHVDGTNLYPRYVSALFLTISPDARSAGMGDVGAASEADINSQYWNIAKYAFLEKNGGISFTYSPCITNLVQDVYLLNLTGYSKVGLKNTVSGSFRYFSHGNLDYRMIGPPMKMNPYEFALDAGYSRRFTDHFSGGIVFRYIQSHPLNGGSQADGQGTQPGKSVSGDLGLYYQNEFLMREKEYEWALGLNFSNIGTPISYGNYEEDMVPIPSNLRLGGRFKININQNNSLSFHLDVNKLLVPTMPEYGIDTITDDLIVLHGKELPESVLKGMVQSFYDAPGFIMEDGTRNVFLEEIHEIKYSIGLEYLYKHRYALRSGFFHEHASKGNRQYFTIGAGAKVRFLSFDVSYLLPYEGQDSPLYNTFRLTLTAEFG